MESKSIVNVRQAVAAAIDYLKSIQDLLQSPLENLRLEEVELSEDKNFWLVTLGFDGDVVTNTSLAMAIAGLPKEQLKREYKVVQINSNTGEVESMRIRKL